ENQHGEHGNSEPKLFPDQIRQAFAGYSAHARSHFLNDDERDRYGNKGPEQRVAELCAGLRVGENSADIVIDVCRDESGTKDREERKHAESPGSGKRQSSAMSGVLVHELFTDGGNSLREREALQNKWEVDSSQSKETKNYTCSRKRVITSSAVMMPLRCCSSSTTASVYRLYFSMTSTTFFCGKVQSVHACGGR